MNTLDKMYLGMQIRAMKAAEGVKRFWKEERGVSNVVATVLLILVVVLIIAIFWDKLQTWLSGMMDNIFQKANEIGGDQSGSGGGN